MKNRSTREIKKYKAIASGLIKHHFGKTPARLTPLSGGLTNFVYEAKVAGEALVIRLSEKPDSINFFLKEQWAVNKAAEIKIPVPEILEVGQDEDAVAYMIVRKMEGDEATLHENRLQIIEEMGYYTAKIHTISTNSFGSIFDWSHNTLSKNESWKNYLHDDLKVYERLQVLRKNRMLGANQYTEVKRHIRNMEALKKQPCLHHGDMRLKNLVINDKGKIEGIIDWEGCVSSIAPYWDISIALHDLSVDEKLCFLKGYGISQKAFGEVAPVIKIFNLLNYAPVIERLAARKDKEKLDQYRTRLSGALDMFSL
jgi:aminoglycoside phosphotransferase (APT) family kinase protein